MKLYYPESRNQIDHVGYNNCIRLFRLSCEKYFTDNPDEADFRVYCNIPLHPNVNELKREGLPLLVYTMYESTVPPKSYIDWLNKHADVVAFPSIFCHDVFKSHGMVKPAGILSIGLNTAELPVCKKPDLPNKPYVFLWQGNSFDKGSSKGGDVAVQAFRDLKKEGRIAQDAKLILKYRPNVQSVLLDPVESPDGIVYVQGDMARANLHYYFSIADCCLFPTRGEGFGLMPLEAMCQGKQTIVTEFSIPYIKDGCCLPIKYRLEDSPFIACHKFLKINLNRLAFNFGRGYKEFHFMPKLLQPRPDGKKFKPFPSRDIGFWESFTSQVINFLSKMQHVLGLWRKRDRKFVTFFQEHPGRDATVDIENLKNKMEWCYKDQPKAEAMGHHAAKYVRTHWGLDRMRADFEQNIKPLLENEALCLK